MTKVSIMGVAGRMGNSIFHLLNAEKDIQIVGATEIEGHPAIGNDIGLVCGEGENISTLLLASTLPSLDILINL